MKRPRQETTHGLPKQALRRSPHHGKHRSPRQAQQRSPGQEQQRSPGQEQQRSPGQTQQRLPGQTQLIPEQAQHTPELNEHQTPGNTPDPNTPDENTPDESSAIENNDECLVGTMHTDGRLRVEVIGGVLEPSGNCSRQTSSIMYERLEPEGYTWKEVSKLAKDFYFEEFKKWVVWKQPDNVIYAAWLKSVAVRYKDLHSRALRQWESKSGLNNRIGMEVWQSWIEKWKTPEFQTKSKTKKKNRRGGAEVGEYPATHTGGSASHRTHAARLAADLNENLDATTLFELMHTN